ncbi:hypothetical protein SLA2020_023890 [Shorea laevis]
MILDKKIGRRFRARHWEGENTVDILGFLKLKPEKAILRERKMRRKREGFGGEEESRGEPRRADHEGCRKRLSNLQSVRKESSLFSSQKMKTKEGFCLQGQNVLE